MTHAFAKKPPIELELPATIRIAPSRINPWRGAKAAGARFTGAQLAVMAAMAIRADDPAIEVVTCRSTASRAEMWWPEGTANPVFVFDCPVLEHRPKGFRLVIAPSGERKLVHESGRLKKGA
jgi:hypothetical protein